MLLFYAFRHEHKPKFVHKWLHFLQTNKITSLEHRKAMLSLKLQFEKLHFSGIFTHTRTYIMTENTQEHQSRVYWDQRKERINTRELEEGRVQLKYIP